MTNTMRVYIIGAGPGDPKLLTLRAAELIESCPVVLYTGSLVPPAVIARARPDAKVLDSSGMTLDAIIEVIVAAQGRGEDVARVHTGDPLLFGSTAEQMRRLDALGIPYEVIPGVSSFTAAAAALGKELTLPELSQTVILTRAEGRTPVPAGEKLEDLARHGATLALFLSITLIKDVVEALAPAYGEDCPVAVVHKASWPDQVILTGTLADIEARVKAARIHATAMVLVGRVLTSTDFADSKLYDPTFTHRFRKGTARASAKRGGEGVAQQKGLAPPAPGPLAGRRLLVGRARPGPSPLAEALRRLGAEVIEAPRISVEPALDCDELTAALARLGGEEGGRRAIVFACKAGVESALDAARPALDDQDIPIFAIGTAAAAALDDRGLKPALRIGEACDEALRAHQAHLAGARLLLVASEDGRPNLTASLEQLGACVDVVKAYRLVRAMPRLEACVLDAIVLPSSSAAHAVLGSDAGPRLVDVPVAAMGKLTAAAATQGGALRVALAETDTVEALVACTVALVSPAERGAPRATTPADAPAPASLVLVYTGHGKGKTTAALGLAFRALGRGMRVAVVQFIKGKWKTGERLFAESIPGLTFLVMGQGFTWESDDLSRDKRAAEAAWDKSKALIAEGAHPVVILDEITYAIHYGFIPLADVIAAIVARPAGVSVVLTGRNAPEELTAVADVVTEMRATKHPFTKGQKALVGIDF
jgi:precorrin-4/cobalt-precorrin-4 C11-methyltransferase